MKTLSDLKQMFRDQVSVDNIKYGWDGGHCYSYIDHSIMSSNFENRDQQNEWDDFTSEWLYDNDDCLPCDISIVDGVVESGCGCHDHLDYDKDREVVEGIINELMNYTE